MRLPIVYKVELSFPTLWSITESSNGRVVHHRLFEVSVMTREVGEYGLLIILLWSSFAIGWIGFNE